MLWDWLELLQPKWKRMRNLMDDTAPGIMILAGLLLIGNELV